MTAKKGEKKEIKGKTQVVPKSKPPCTCSHIERNHTKGVCDIKSCKCKKYKPSERKPKPRKSKGKPKQRRSNKQCMEIGKQICEQYAKGISTIESICLVCGIEYATFYNWVSKGRGGFVQELHDLYKKAGDVGEANYSLALKNQAKESLLRKVSYTQVTETHTERVRGRIVSVRTVEKTLAPSDNAIIFALTNTDPKNFKNKHSVTGDVTIRTKEKYDGMTMEELEVAEKELDAELKKVAKKSS